MNTDNLRLLPSQVLFVLSIFFSQMISADQDALFEQGIESFGDGNYQYALDVFKQARDVEGMDTPQLHYNIGVSQYKLGHYDQSATSFKKLLQNNSFKELAQYNLGLAALNRENRQAARYWFMLSSQGKNPQMRKAAKRMLAKFDGESDSFGWLHEINGAVVARFGSDSNVNNSINGSPSNVSDSFQEYYALIDAPVIGNRRKGLVVDASVYKLDFSKVNRNDFDQLQLGIAYKTKLAQWRTSTRVFTTKSDLESKDYQRQVGLELKGRLKLSRNSRIHLRYQYYDITSQDVLYNELQGLRQKFRVQHRYKKSGHRTRLIYELETNNREDTATSSSSPTRNTIRGVYTGNITDDLRWRADVAYRKSSYPDVAGSARDDDRTSYSLYLMYRLTADLEFRAKYRNKNNSSSNPIFNYDRDIVTAGLSYIF